jgi:hypothetical protein
MVINTFWDSTTPTKYRKPDLNLEENQTICGPETSGRCDPPVRFNSTKLAGVKFDGEKYVCSRPYAIITIIVAWVLFMAAVISLILAAGLTTAPDILGYISTYLRDNPYCEVYAPHNLDGLDTARILGDAHIIVGDVKGEESIGHIAIATEGAGVRRLERKRVYD